MSKVTITLEDSDDGQVDVKVEFDGEGADMRRPGTPAQHTAMAMLSSAVANQVEDSDE